MSITQRRSSNNTKQVAKRELERMRINGCNSDRSLKIEQNEKKNPKFDQKRCSNIRKKCFVAVFHDFEFFSALNISPFLSSTKKKKKNSARKN